jgi:hypothetical protein
MPHAYLNFALAGVLHQQADEFENLFELSVV